jgi:hypothetical protein
MRRRLLRFLNPLQVVELPREDPEAPLRLFADVPGLRVLVLGGDGSVGWILACLDSLHAAFAAEPGRPRHWTPPPVGVLPLGTGEPPRTLRFITCHEPGMTMCRHCTKKEPLRTSMLRRVLWLVQAGCGVNHHVHCSTATDLAFCSLRHLSNRRP